MKGCVIRCNSKVVRKGDKNDEGRKRHFITGYSSVLGWDTNGNGYEKKKVLGGFR